MSGQSITQISLKANEELVKRTKQRTKRSFYMVGKEHWVDRNLTGKGKPNWQLEGIDFLTTFTHLSKVEQLIICIIKDAIKWNTEVNSYIYIVELDQYSLVFDKSTTLYVMAYKSFLKGFQLLFQRDLVRRTGRNHYMMNPEFFIIHGEQSLYFGQAWSQAKVHTSN